MHRKVSFLLTILILFSLVFTPIGQGSVLAQDEPPPPRPTPTHPRSPVYDPELKTDVPVGEPSSAAGEAYEESQADAQALLPLGQPGLSFRYVETLGVTGEPYLADGSHINMPNGLFISGNNLFVAEEVGNRILKFNLANPATATLVIGHAGIPWHHDDYVSYPRDVAVRSSNGHIWIVANPMVKEFDANGNFIQSIPQTNPWEPGNDNMHFDDPYGIAFGPNGYLFVSDQWNHRIQIYNVAGAAPVYVATIGTTGVPKADNTGFNYPMQIAFDSLNRLYVMDNQNYRVQRCTSAAPWKNWTCTKFFGQTGVPGTDLSHLGSAEGIGIDASNNVYLADGTNFRVLKCNPSGVCSIFAGETGVEGSDNAHFKFIDDVAVDATGNVYVSDTLNFRVQKYNSAKVYQSTIGVNGVPYVTDTTRMFAPWGLTVAGGNIYAVEKYGLRLIKMDTAGVQQWTVGEAGVNGFDNAHFAQYTWTGGPEGSPAVDASGRVYVSDTHNHRVQIFNSDGSFHATLGNGWGQGNYDFACPAGVGISPVNGDVYVVERCNQRVQVFTSALVYKATLGQTQVEGQDNFHFSWPSNVKIAPDGSIFVTDSDNFRVQKCKFTTGTNYTCSTFAGETGAPPNGTYARMHPMAIALDAQGRVYVADDWNNRVQVYSSTGAYLSTIGGDWSTLSGGLIGPMGVGVDSQGNVYVSDMSNHRIQKFSPGVPGWRQTNLNGFGIQAIDMISTLGTFKNTLYAGTTHWDGFGGQIWASQNGTTWTRVMLGGFGNPANYGIDHLMEFNGYLYAGTWSNEINGGEVWRTSNGTAWTRVVNDGFGNTNNGEVFRFEVFKNMLYASTWPYSAAEGGQIWRTNSGNEGTWSKVVHNGFGDAVNTVTSFEVFGTNLYAGTMNNTTGGQIWRSDTGNAGDWQKVAEDGFGTPENFAVTALATFNSYLYAATGHVEGGATQIWRCQLCNGSDWENVTGSWPAASRRMPALETKSGMLYAVMGNSETGLEVWQTKDGTSWEQVGFNGFEGSNNRAVYWDNALSLFMNELYLGTIHTGGGGQIWRTVSMNISGNTGVAGTALNYSEGAAKKVTSLSTGNYSFTVPYNWDGTVTPTHGCFTFNPVDRSYANVTSNQPSQNYTPTIKAGCADVKVSIGGVDQARYGVAALGSMRVSYAGLDKGPVKVESTNAVPLMAAERVMYKVNNVVTSFSEMMALPNSQLDTVYWLPWYNSKDLNTQLRIANVSNATANIQVIIGGQDMGSFTLTAGASKRLSYTAIDKGPVQIISDQNIIVSERVIYKVNNVDTSFSEMMALPASQLDTTYWLPWYNNKDIDTQLRIANVSDTTATVNVSIGGTPVPGSPFTLTAGASKRLSFPLLDKGPVRIESDVNIIASERVIYKVNTLGVSFSETMALPASQLDTIYWMPWYNNKDIDTQLRIANVSDTTATVNVSIGGTPVPGSPFTLTAGASKRLSFTGIDRGPVKIESDVNVVASERVIYRVNNIVTSFSEMMGLPNSQLDSLYWLPWYNNKDLDTQLRFGVP